MKSVTKALGAKLPTLGAQEDKGPDTIAYVHFFTADAQWTWYATQFDGYSAFGGDGKGNYPKLGRFSLAEVEQIRVAWASPWDATGSPHQRPFGR